MTYSPSFGRSFGLLLFGTILATAYQPLDFINLMTYDFHGAWTEHTGHDANLYPPVGPDSMQRSAAASVNLFVKAGIPPSKLVLGVPFYGRGWSGADETNDGLYQRYAKSRESYSYDALTNHVARPPGAVRQSDAAARAPSLRNADSSLLITYKNPASLPAKAYFVHSRGLGGIMDWEHNADDGTLLKTLSESLP